MKHVIIMATALLLCACGVDGEPSTPEPVAKTTSGITISGQAKTGVRKKW